MRTTAVAAFLLAAGLSAALASGADPRKAPFKVLYSNDTTNITSCVSPFHAKSDGITDAMIRATIDEAADADVHLLQPGMGWIPWWKSTIYPAEEHYRYYEERYGVQPNAYGRYMLEGGDIVKTFVDHCRAKGVVPFVSLRLNDGHGLEHAGKGNSWAMHAVSRFYEDHYQQYRIGPDPSNWNEHVLNWAIPEVREHKLAFIREICENYDIDGFELDFMRHSSYFQLDRTTPDERCEIITGFVRRVREVLDRPSKPGRRRWLCVRAPAYVDDHDPLGINLPAMVAAGVEMVNASGHYFTVQQTDLARIRRLLPETALYLEMTHTPCIGPSRGYDSFPYRRTTAPQFFTTAHLAYQQGADGMSLFNFVYYREHGSEGRGPFNEPPFEVISRLSDRCWLASQPQWYVLAPAWRLTKDARPLPRHFSKGQSRSFSLQMAPGEQQVKDGLLRLMTRLDCRDCRWDVRVNGASLTSTEPVLKPLDHPYEAGLGEPAQYACFVCPRTAVRAGVNEIEIRLEAGPAAVVEYLDIVLQ